MEEIFFKYNIFLTAWGWVGLVVDQKGLKVKVLILPEKREEDVLLKIKEKLKDNNIKEENREFENLIQKIKEYFSGKKIDFLNYKLNLDEFTDFQKAILQTVKKIPYGQIKTYQEVAIAAGYPKAYRAVGNTMAQNPIPLIIPCHRVIGSNGKLGGFSASGGIDLKQKMLDIESEGK